MNHTSNIVTRFRNRLPKKQDYSYYIVMEWLLSMKISGERVFMIRVNIEFNDKYWRTENTMVKRTNNYLQNIAHKTKDRVTWTPLKAECEWSCYTSGTGCVTLFSNPVISHRLSMICSVILCSLHVILPHPGYTYHSWQTLS